MIVKAKSPIPTKPKPVCGQSGNKVVQPVRCTTGGEVMVYQVNEPGVVGNGVNRKNKDGTLILGDDGKCLRNVKVDPDGNLIVRHDQPINVNMPVVTVQGMVSVSNKVAVEPVTVANMPSCIRIQEHLNVVQTPIKTQVMPIDFNGYERMVIGLPCWVYSIYLTVYEPTFVELVGITGEMWTKEFKLNLFPQFIQMDEIVIKAREFVHIGGYITYESC